MIRIGFLSIVVMTLISCEPEEIPADIERIINYTQIDIGKDYCYQKYYDIENDVVVGENLITDWDLAFHNTQNAIMLNSSKQMRAIFVEDTVGLNDLASVFQSSFLEIGYDDPSGSLESLALNNGQDELCQGYFVLDKGWHCSDDQQLGYVILNIVDYNENIYAIEIFYEAGGLNETIEILKTTNDDYTYFSLSNNETISIADFDWDLCFSRYTEFDVPNPANSSQMGVYLLVGVLQNSHVAVAIDNNNSFSDISIDLIDNYTFHSDRNSIGWDWKEYDSVNDLYTIAIDAPVYVIKTSDNDYYKLLFLDYYNDNGEKGAPAFQIEQL